MKVLITGGNGFLGSKLKERLVSEGYEVKTLSLNGCDFNFDISKKENFDLINNDFDIIFHLAGLILPFQSFNNPYIFFKVNSLGTLNVLDFALKNKSKIVFASTSKVYGKGNTLPFKEDMKLNPDSPYGYSKLVAEKFCENYSKFYDLDTSILRFFNIYGPGQNKNLLIPIILKQAKEGNVIHLKGSAVPKRDFVFVDDVIDAMVKAIKVNGIFNIGFGKSYSVKEIIEIVSSLLDKNLSIETEMKEEYSKGARDEIAGISKARKELKWFPKTFLKDGLKKMLF